MNEEKVMLVEAVRESIAAAEQRRAAVDAELETLREIEGLAEKLNGDDAPAAPMRPRQHDATRAERRAGKKTSARRSPATSAASGASQRQAPAGGRYDAAEVLEKTRQAIAGTSTTFSISEVARELGYPDKNDRALAAVRQAVLDLIGEKVVEEAGKGRGGHPRYVCVDTSAPGDQVTGELVDRIVEVLELDGGRVGRLDLKTRVGDPDPDFDEFGSALDLLLAERKIERVSAGGVTGYELVR
jgi:hypothetical protein